MAPQQQHFLVVAFPVQGHLNPARALAERLSQQGARVTLSTAVSAHRLMFPSLASPDEEVHHGAISYIPYSDGYDRGFGLLAGDARSYVEAFGRVGRETFSAVLDRLAARGQPVTCVVYAMIMWWAAEVARERGVPRALYWIQPATTLAVYYHYFHGYERVVTEHAAEPGFTVAMPGLPPMAIRDLPSFFTNLTDERMVALFGDMRRTFEELDLDSTGSGGKKPMVLVNTVEALEMGALASVQPELNVFPIGPAVLSLFADGPNAIVGDLFQHDEKAGYMEWLDTKPARSVVYVSFGSMSAASKRQKEEMKRGLTANNGRSCLWVVRKDNKDNDEEDRDADEERSMVMVVEWCDQVRVLSHPAVGCFVTHCGWNSTLESVACGVPVVAVPQWSDQDTNASLVVEWGIGVRAKIDAEDRFLDTEELTRCVEMVMGDTEDGAAIRRSLTAWKAKLQEAITDGGSSEHYFRAFRDQFANDA